MPTIAVSEIIERAKSAADMRDDFVTETEWLRWFNVERRKLESLIARTGYVLRSDTVGLIAGSDIVAGVASIPEPLAILGVYQIDSNGYYQRLRHSDQFDGAQWRSANLSVAAGDATIWSATQPPDSNDLVLRFYPHPQTGTYIVHFIPQPDVVTSTATNVNYPISWEEYIVLGIAKRALAKEETFNAGLNAEHDDITRHIESSCWDRLMGANKAVRNVDPVERGWSRDLVVPSRENWYYV